MGEEEVGGGVEGERRWWSGRRSLKEREKRERRSRRQRRNRRRNGKEGTRNDKGIKEKRG